ncbi:MAG: prepilin-type N-terminal cleavage/methylation domain-containing protein [Candidatus Omnitrophica bacterium]|nr:prepilin-type N-terminal cleavage/methylation domain-containing protein [Candidatus Omnitrophota bacterium]MDD5355556.1 prepilin-type N-terminal cleavage/methylation domain-containing protein [Candidatus Omnitrophota bacterium]
MKKLTKRGFTLVEIMIVVAIIILLAAIAIPNLLRARLNANEAAAIAALRTVSTACESYRAAQTSPTYPGALTDLSGASPAYIDSTLGSGTKQGYSFTYSSASAGTQYSCTAAPVTGGVTGSRTFIVNESGVIVSGGTYSGGTAIQ